MLMQSELGRHLYRKCQLDVKIQQLELEKQSLKERLPEALAAKREADAALLAYECGGLRPFLDRLSGRWEEKRENLTREARTAEAALGKLHRDLEITEDALTRTTADADGLQVQGDILEMAQTLETEEREVILRKVASTFAEKLLSLLDNAKTALEEAQEWARPNNRVDTAPGYTKGKLLAKAECYARECKNSMQQIERCGILLEIHPYFHNPSGYIHGVAAQFAELDRINRALEGIRQTRKQTQELLLQLSDEEM